MTYTSYNVIDRGGMEVAITLNGATVPERLSPEGKAQQTSRMVRAGKHFIGLTGLSPRKPNWEAIVDKTGGFCNVWFVKG